MSRGARVSRRVVLAATVAGAAAFVRPPDRLAETAVAQGQVAQDESESLRTLAQGRAAAARPGREQVVGRYGRVRPASWGLALPGIVTSLGSQAVADKAVALTFDACGASRRDGPGNGVDAALIALLRRHDVRATLFLNSRWVAANPRVFDDIADDPRFEIANHGTRHLPLSVSGRAAYGEIGTRDAGEAYDEVAGNHDALTWLLGRPPRWFRSGTAHYDDVAVRLVGELGERPVGFSVNADGGATFPRSQIQHTLRHAGPGDIVIGHMNRPTRETAAGYALGLPELLRRGLRTATLSEYLDRPAG
ncbi:MAG: polysaccharide deacetylase family protein [Austwickia sp.]|nr:MAG: polysaccharide deacetylase family protein [Austwickia sp.]